MSRSDKLRSAIVDGVPIGPERVMISPTDTCNITCRTCWRLDKDEDPNLWKDQELGLQEIEAVLDDCVALGVEGIDFTGGGEPFARPDIFDILGLIKARGLSGSLTNNGTLLGEERARRLIAMGLDDICFSMESFEPEVNDAIRGSGVTEKAVRALETVRRLKGELGSDVPALRIGTVVTNLNYNRLDGLIDFAARNGVAAINFSLMLVWSSNRDLAISREQAGEVLDALGRARERIDRHGFYSNLPSILRHGLFEHELPRFCFAPWDMAFVNSRGEVLACCILASVYENVLGNVRNEGGFKALWTGEAMERFRARIREGRYYEDCRLCLPEFIDIFNGRCNDMEGPGWPPGNKKSTVES